MFGNTPGQADGVRHAMRLIKTLFWLVIAAALIGIFLINPARVDLVLPGMPLLNGRLGFFLLVAFLLGMVPMYLWHKLRAWGLRRQLRKVQAQTPAATPAAAAVPDDPEAALDRRARAAGYASDMPAQARPIAVPPAGA